MQPADYDRFKPFFSRVLADYHNVSESAKHVNSWDLDSVEGLPEGNKLDLAALGLDALSMRVRVGRNLATFPLPGAMTKEQRVALESKVSTREPCLWQLILLWHCALSLVPCALFFCFFPLSHGTCQMCEAFEVLKAMPEYGGRYHSLTPEHADFISEDEYQALVKEHIMFKDMAADPYLASAGIASDWPYGRGCYVSEDRCVCCAAVSLCLSFSSFCALFFWFVCPDCSTADSSSGLERRTIFGSCA